MGTKNMARFHWVHKDTQSSSLSNTSGSESREIRRFVQYQHLSRRKRGDLQIRWSKRMPGIESGPITSPKAIPIIKDETAENQSEIFEAAQRPIESLTVVATKKDDDNQALRLVIEEKSAPERGGWHHRHHQHRGRQSRSNRGNNSLVRMQSRWKLSPTNITAGSSIDPFNHASIPMTEEVDMFMKYFQAAQLAGGNPYKLHVLPVYVRDVVKMDQLVQSYCHNYLRYEYCMYAMMAFMSVRLITVTKVRLFSIKPPEHYMYKAITSLRDRLQQYRNPGLEIDLATIGAMNQIALAGWMSGSFDAARIHLKILSEMLKHVNQDDPSGRFMIESIRTLDLQVALESRQMPYLPVAPSFEQISRGRISQIMRINEHAVSKLSTTHLHKFFSMAIMVDGDSTPPGDILADCDMTLDFRLGWRLKEVLETQVLYSSIRSIIRNVLDCLTIAKCVWRTSQATTKDTRWMCRTARMTVHHLWSYGWDHANDEDDLQHRLTDSVRLALLVMLTLATNRMASRAVSVLSEELYVACQRLSPSTDTAEAERQVYIWCLLTGALVSGAGTEPKRWLLCEAAAVAHSLGLLTYKALHEVMTGFVYSWTVQMQTLQDVVKIIELGKTEVKEK